MRGKQAIFNIEIKKKSGLSINPDIHHSKVFSSGHILKKLTWERKQSLNLLKISSDLFWIVFMDRSILFLKKELLLSVLSLFIRYVEKAHLL